MKIYRLPFLITLFSFTVLSASELPLPRIGPARDNVPEGWEGHRAPHLERIQGVHKVVEQGGRPHLHLEKLRFDSVMQVKTSTPYTSNASRVTLAIRHRIPEIDLPAENPGRNRFRVGVVFYNAAGEKIADATPQLAYGTAQHEWTTSTITYDVPEGTTRIEVSFNLLNCVGIWEIQGVRLLPAS